MVCIKIFLSWSKPIVCVGTHRKYPCNWYFLEQFQKIWITLIPLNHLSPKFCFFFYPCYFTSLLYCVFRGNAVVSNKQILPALFLLKSNYFPLFLFFEVRKLFLNWIWDFRIISRVHSGSILLLYLMGFSHFCEGDFMTLLAQTNNCHFSLSVRVHKNSIRSKNLLEWL